MLCYVTKLDNENDVFELAEAQNLEDIENNEIEENSKEQPCSISINECMQAISTVQGYFQVHGGSY